MTDTTIYPNNTGTGTPYIHTSGHHSDHGVRDLISNNAIINEVNRTSSATQKEVYDASIATQKYVSDGTVSGINTTNLTATATQKAGYDGVVSTIDNINRNSTAIQKNGYDGVVSTNKNLTDGFTATNKAVSDFQASAALAISEGRLATAIASGEMRLSQEISDNVTRGNMAVGFTANAVSAKDLELATYRDGSHTREESKENFAELAKDTAKGFADGALLALQNRAALELDAAKTAAALSKEIDKICCCVSDKISEDGARTRAEIGRNEGEKLRAELAESRMQNLLNRSVGNIGTATK